MKSVAAGYATAIVLLSGLSLPALAADWPMYRCNAARSGYTAEAIPNQLQLRWTYRCDHPPSSAWPTADRVSDDEAFQPIVVGDQVFLGSSADDRITAIDAVTGKQQWSFVTDGPVRFAPAAWGDRIFAVSDDGWIYAIRMEDGELIWKHRGGPDDEKLLGNGRLVSRWPARGGPVVFEDTVYFAAGIWPSEGVYLHAIDASSGEQIWTNEDSGGIFMPQPHGTADAKSGVSPQGYLLANETQLFVPTGRAVPAAFHRADGKFDYYHLQKNGTTGGSFALLADRFLLNGGVLFEQESGKACQKPGFGPKVATPKGLLVANGRSLKSYHWKDIEKPDRKGKLQKHRVLEAVRVVQGEHEILELVVAAGDAIRGEPGRVSAVNYQSQSVTWWSHNVDGNVRGLAVAGGRIIATTDSGFVYCFDGVNDDRPAQSKQTIADNEQLAPSADSPFAKAADEIVKKAGITDGYCVDLGAGTGELAIELAKRTNLQIYVVENDATKAATARRNIEKAGLYGVRITVHQAPTDKTSYPDYFADLVVSSMSLTTALNADTSTEAARIQRPYGGTICTGPVEQMMIQTRGALEGAGSWTHQNSNSENTICSVDSKLQGPLRMLWFRDVDFDMPDRHGQGPAPLVNNGYMVVGGVDGLCCVDAYNGRRLWTFEVPGHLRDYDGIHHDVGIGDTGGTFCLSDDSVFVRTGNRCLRIALATGKQLAEYTVPGSKDDDNKTWGYLAYKDGLIFGSNLNDAHTVSPRYKLTKLRTESVSLFAINTADGKHLWHHKPQHSIRNNAIAIDSSHVYLIDRPLAMQDQITNPRRNGRHRPKLKPGEHPGGDLIALEKGTGKVVWRQSDDIFGTQLAVSEKHGTLLMYFQAVRHTFFKLPSETGGQIAAVSTIDGKRLWEQKATYQTRPIINDTGVYAQGGSWNLLTGKPLDFKLERSYGCGQISASTNMMLFRSATLGYVDLTKDDGTQNFGGIRPSCWINAVPAGGIVLVPDGSPNCQCSYQMKAWFALQGTN